jgi:hypothetical protein
MFNQDEIIDSNINFFQACIAKADQMFLTNITEVLNITGPKQLEITISFVDPSVASEIIEAFKKSIDMIVLHKGLFNCRTKITECDATLQDFLKDKGFVGKNGKES